MKHYQCGDQDQDIQDLRRDLASSLRIQRKLVRTLRAIVRNLSVECISRTPTAKRRWARQLDQAIEAIREAEAK